MRDLAAKEAGDPSAAGILDVGRQTADIFANLVSIHCSADAPRDGFSDPMIFRLPSKGEGPSFHRGERNAIAAACTDEGKLYLNLRDKQCRALLETARDISDQIKALEQSGKRMRFDMSPRGSGNRKYNDIMKYMTEHSSFDRKHYPGMSVEYGNAGDEHHRLTLMFPLPRTRSVATSRPLTLMFDSNSDTLYYASCMDQVMEAARRAAAGLPSTQDRSYLH
jgi:hypothetical protein